MMRGASNPRVAFNLPFASRVHFAWKNPHEFWQRCEGHESRRIATAKQPDGDYVLPCYTNTQPLERSSVRVQPGCRDCRREERTSELEGPIWDAACTPESWSQSRSSGAAAQAGMICP